MVKGIPHQEKALDARDLQVRFSPAVQDAFRSVAVAARASEHFDAGIYEIIKDWSSDKPTTIHDFMIVFPAIASEMTSHITSTRDSTMKEAWEDLCLQLPEQGFTISQQRQRRR
jgi:hypothetical protein